MIKAFIKITKFTIGLLFFYNKTSKVTKVLLKNQEQLEKYLNKEQFEELCDCIATIIAYNDKALEDYGKVYNNNKLK